MVSKFKGPQFYNEEDKSIFKGRENESDYLLYIVENSDFSVCYAVSGEGKSSLINAGLCPKLRDHGFLPIHIKNIADAEIGCFDEFVWHKVKDAIKEEQKKAKYAELAILKLEPKPNCQKLADSVWWKLRTREFRINSFETVTPVLIFDQFEEVFSSAKDLIWTDAFFLWLESLYNDENPLASGYNGKLQKKFKALFSLRSEYVCELDYWAMNKHFIPSLKNNRYYLKPLTKGAAFEVAKQLDLSSSDLDSLDIIQYAKSERAGVWDNINNDIPCISALILSLLLTALSKRNEEIESKIKEINKSGCEDKGKELFDFLLENVYQRAITKCNDTDNVEVTKFIEVLEDTLIDVNGKRRHVPEGELPEIDNEKIKDALDVLESERIINVIDHHYEISHDSLCQIVLRRKEERHTAQHREQNKQNAITKAALKRDLIVKKSWNDYLLLFPLFLFVIFSVYFLLNAVMNEIILYLGDFYEQEKLSAYEELKIRSILKSYHVHLIGNVLLILWIFFVSNVYVLYSNGYRNLRFKAYNVLVLTGAIALCYWHHEYYATPLHDVFIRLSPSDESLGWKFVYGGLVGIPLLLLILSVINKAIIEKDWKWHEVLFLKPLFSLKATKWYLIILLFVCLYLCVIPEYRRIVTSGESIIFVLLIGIITHSFFEKRRNWSSRLLYYAPIILLCLCLWYIEIEDVITCIGDLSQIILRHPATYYLLVFVVFFILEYFICRKYANLRKYNLVKVLGTTFFIMGIVSLLYIGYLPWKGGQLVSPVQYSMNKWKYYISQNDSAYGAYFADGRTFVPCVFDSVDLNNQQELFLYGKPYYLRASRNDSLLKGSSDTLKSMCYDIYYNRNMLKVKPSFLYLFHLGTNKVDSLALAVYQEILNNVSQRVKYGRKLSPSYVPHMEELRTIVSRQADLLYNKLSNRDTTKVLPSDSLMHYFETVVREFSILALNDMMKSNDLNSTAYTLDLFAYSFFHQILKKGNLQMSINGSFNLSCGIYQLGFNQKAMFDVKALDLYQINGWQQLWKTLHFYIKRVVALDLAYNYKSIVDSFQKDVDRVKGIVNQPIVSTEDIVALSIRSILSTDQAERKEIKNTATNILKQNESRLKEILDNSQGLIENFEFKNMNVEIGKACEHRRKQIKDLTYNTMYMNFGKETIREMMSIRMFCAFDIKGLKEENDLLKDMYHNDTVSINDTYYSFLSLQNGVIKIIKSLEELDSSAKKAKNSK